MMNSNMEDEQFDFKYDKDPPKIKAEPWDAEIKMEIEESDMFPVNELEHIDIKPDPYFVVSNKSTVEVEETKEKLNKVLQDYEEKPQNQGENLQDDDTVIPAVCELKADYEEVTSKEKYVCAFGIEEKSAVCNSSNIEKCNMPARTIASSFTCNVCNRSFSKKEHLIRHFAIHTAEKPYICDICFKSFARKCGLDRHKFIHSGEKSFACNVCSKSFSQRELLNRHMNTHTGQTSYCCIVCNKSFFEKYHLNRHMNTHTCEKPFRCDICSKLFSQKYSLKEHMYIHIEDKRLTCNICSKSFSQTSSLNRHTRIHSGDKPFTCNICNKSFSQRSHLAKHKHSCRNKVRREGMKTRDRLQPILPKSLEQASILPSFLFHSQ